MLESEPVSDLSLSDSKNAGGKTELDHARPDTVVGVVIPYFQRKPGLLARAIRSALEQEGETEDSLIIVVVDDGSPQSPAKDIETLSKAEQARVKVISQKNGGVSAARNTALDAMPEEVGAIAFLDSDDAWRPQHLANARIALRMGADFYFADHKREGADITRFAECSINSGSGEKMPAGSNLYCFRGDLFDTILHKSPIGTSTVVFRRALAPELRFRVELSAGEDTLFWLSLVHRKARAMFSLNEEADYGIGVNIFAAAGWGSPTALTMLANTASFHRIVPGIFPLSAELMAWNTSWRRRVRRDFALNFLHLLFRREKIDWRSFWNFSHAEPSLLVDILAAPLRRGR